MAHVDFCGVGDASIQRPFVLSEYLQGTLVDVTGRTLHESGPLDTGDLQWSTRNVLAQALTNGYSAIPILAGPCPHPNARLNCAHFRTDISILEAHKSELQQTDRVIAKATASGWARQIEMNERKRNNLFNIITSLERAHAEKYNQSQTKRATAQQPTLERTLSGLHRSEAWEGNINFRSVAAEAKVSAAWLYGPGKLRARIMRSRRHYCFFHDAEAAADGVRVSFLYSALA
jgi:hypothetical protein